MHLFIAFCLFIAGYPSMPIKASLPGEVGGLVLNGAEMDSAKKEKSYIEFLDVAYGDAPGNENLLDAYLPKERTGATKVIVYIHGGSWVRGSKKEFPEALIEELVGKRKYALASINYRLVKDGNNIFPAQIEDVKKALAFIAENAEQYEYDGDHFALMGASAGAHLAMLYAYAYDSRKQVKTVIDIFGPIDLADKTIRGAGMESNDIITNFLGTPDTAAQIVKTASPYYHLSSATAVPTIIFHGTEDELVPVSQSKKLNNTLREAGVASQIELYPGEKHELRPPVALDVFGKIITWLAKYYPSEPIGAK
ncbi:MAG TPA: alpha/beta hydrolase [Agriterribacter sp.]|nr:alpha/beta hydrolase [Agriterribacter sp.]